MIYTRLSPTATPGRLYGSFAGKAEMVISSRGAMRVVHNARGPAVIVRDDRVARVVRLSVVPTVVKG